MECRLRGIKLALRLLFSIQVIKVAEELVKAVGGCSGLRYELAFDDRLGEADSVIETHGVKIVVDEKSALYLMGTTLDFVDTLNETGFKMGNPNASTTCGCGESFAA